MTGHAMGRNLARVDPPVNDFAPRNRPGLLVPWRTADRQESGQNTGSSSAVTANTTRTSGSPSLR